MKTHFISAFILVITLFTACSKEDEAPDTRALFEGSYFVQERFIDSDSIIDTYGLEIEAGASRQDLNIHNFGDFMHVPIVGKTNGQKFTIPEQSFTEDALTVRISGEGEVDGDTLQFTYRRVVDNSSSGFHADTEYRCSATKQ